MSAKNENSTNNQNQNKGKNPTKEKKTKQENIGPRLNQAACRQAP